MNDSSTLKSILLLAANPKGTVNLRLQEEEREIRERLRLAGYGKVPINSTGATRTRDIQQAMLDFKPQIVHFTGHGAGKDGLAFEDGTGQLKLVDSYALANLFKLFSSRVECVVLNACYSQVQAEAIAQHIDYVVGMNQAIGDDAAIEFAVGFYTALGAGESVEFAYKLGCNAIQLEGIPEHLTPVLCVRSSQAHVKESVRRIKYMVILSTTIDEVNKPLVEAMLNHLRQISGDASLTLQRIETGSIKLVLEGAEEGYIRLMNLFSTGEISEVLGIPIQNIESDDEITQNSIEEDWKAFHTVLKQEFLNYLRQDVGIDAAQLMELYLQGQSLEQIAQSMNAPIKQVYRLHEKVNYHAFRFFSLREQYELTSTLLGLQTPEHRLIDTLPSLTPEQWQTFWQSLTSEQKQLLEKLKRGEKLETIANELNSEHKQIIGELNRLNLLYVEFARRN